MKKKKSRSNGSTTISALVALLIAILWALAVSDGGLGFIAHWGIQRQNIQRVTGTCIEVDITKQFDMLKHTEMNSYSLRLSKRILNNALFRFVVTEGSDKSKFPTAFMCPFLK